MESAVVVGAILLYSVFHRIAFGRLFMHVLLLAKEIFEATTITIHLLNSPVMEHSRLNAYDSIVYAYVAIIALLFHQFKCQ